MSESKNKLYPPLVAIVKELSLDNIKEVCEIISGRPDVIKIEIFTIDDLNKMEEENEDI